MKNPYLDLLLENEEMQFYIKNFGIKENPTEARYKNMNKTELLKLYDAVINKTSNLSRKERDLVVYFAEKL